MLGFNFETKGNTWIDKVWDFQRGFLINTLDSAMLKHTTGKSYEKILYLSHYATPISPHFWKSLYSKHVYITKIPKQ